MKLKIKEQDICAGISDYLALKKIHFRRIHSIGLVTTKGVSDYWLVIDGMSIALEVKKPTSNLTKDQAEFLKSHWEASGCSWVIRDLDELIKCLDMIKDKIPFIYSSQREKDFGGLNV